jgi:hypothetical protein
LYYYRFFMRGAVGWWAGCPVKHKKGNHMNAVRAATVPAWVGKALAILSVAFAWVLPWSPLLAVAALRTTTQQPRWYKLAVVGAILSVVISIAVGAIMLSGAIWIWLNL